MVSELGIKKDHRAGAFMHCWPVPTTQDAVWVRRPLEKSWQCGRGVSGPGGPCSGGLSLGTGVALKEQRAGWCRWHQGHRFALRAWWGGGGRGGGPSITMMSDRLFSNESVLRIQWPKYWSFNFSISPSNEYSGLISFTIDWLISSQSKGL